MIIQQLLRKWFNLDEPICQTCEYLKLQLEKSESERNRLINSLLNKSVDSTVAVEETEIKALNTSRYLPWHIKRQQLEAADKIKAEELREAEKLRINIEKEINNTKTDELVDKLEEELGVVNADS